MVSSLKDRISNVSMSDFLLALCILLIVVATVQIGWFAGFVLPIMLLGFVYLYKVFQNPFYALLGIYIVNYFIMGAVRYYPSIQGGIIMDGLVALTIVSMLIYRVQHHQLPWERTKNILNICVGMWLLYCFFQLFNPESVSTAAWLTGVRAEAWYFMLIIVFTQLLCVKYEMMKKICFVWSVLVILAVMKALMQKFIGFDAAERRWLFVDGFARTHIIQTGIRYFSFFTDAANFGAGMGYSMVFFSIAALSDKSKFIKYYYGFVALLACYGMMISGTRTAMVVPFVGYFMYTMLRGKRKAMITVGSIILFFFIFFKYTMILNGNPIIRRMRSGFNAEQDASYLVRLENQKKMKLYMTHRYFGVGIGLGGGKAKRYAPNAYMSQIPTDSWFVMIWVETGIVGLILHIVTLVIIMLYGAYIIAFKIRDQELKGYLCGMYGGVLGMIVASYANEIFGQFPNGFTIFTGMAFIYLGPYYDKELVEKENQELIDQSYEIQC